MIAPDLSNLPPGGTAYDPSTGKVVRREDLPREHPDALPPHEQG